MFPFIADFAVYGIFLNKARHLAKDCQQNTTVPVEDYKTQYERFWLKKPKRLLI